jgi:hypothetical protein
LFALNPLTWLILPYLFIYVYVYIPS